jgi:hypothetical protein
MGLDGWGPMDGALRMGLETQTEPPPGMFFFKLLFFLVLILINYLLLDYGRQLEWISETRYDGWRSTAGETRWMALEALRIGLETCRYVYFNYFIFTFYY